MHPTDSRHPGTDILFVFAHPDDESFGQSATIMAAKEHGLTTGLVCLTRGEAGQIRAPERSTRESLAAVREIELRHAMRIAGLTELRIVGYRDSGMDGDPDNSDPRALIMADREAVICHVIAHIRDLRPRTVVTFGPDGIYGHPDHVFAGDVTDAAVVRAADDTIPGLGEPWQATAFYHVAVSRERIRASAALPHSPFSGQPEEELAKLGTPDEQITHRLNARSFMRQKANVLQQHITQIGPDSPMINATDDELAQFIGVEHYVRMPLPWESAADDPIAALCARYPLGE